MKGMAKKMKFRTRICEGCGIEFEPNSPSQKFHSKECAKKYGAVYIPKKKRKKVPSKLAELNQQARDAGLTYGKYVELIEKGK